MSPAFNEYRKASAGCPANRLASFTAYRRHCVLFLSIWLLVGGTPLVVPLEAAVPASYEVEQVDQAPTPKKTIRFRLPHAVKKRGGEITLRFLVKEDGAVDEISVVNFTDADMIDPIYTAYEKASYSPGIKNGIPVSTWMTVTEKAE